MRKDRETNTNGGENPIFPRLPSAWIIIGRGAYSKLTGNSLGGTTVFFTADGYGFV